MTRCTAESTESCGTTDVLPSCGRSRSETLRVRRARAGSSLQTSVATSSIRGAESPEWIPSTRAGDCIEATAATASESARCIVEAEVGVLRQEQTRVIHGGAVNRRSRRVHRVLTQTRRGRRAMGRRWHMREGGGRRLLSRPGIARRSSRGGRGGKARAAEIELKRNPYDARAWGTSKIEATPPPRPDLRPWTAMRESTGGNAQAGLAESSACRGDMSGNPISSSRLREARPMFVAACTG